MANDRHISREGLVMIAQEVEVIRSRLNKIENMIQEETLNRRKDDLNRGEQNGKTAIS